MSPASNFPVLPEQFGRYTGVKPLGQGGMGAVYRAHDPQLKRDVVLKVCLLADNPEAKERFQREARAAASLAPHQNLCPVYEFDVHDGIAYLTMAFVEGPTLNKWAAQRGGLSQREAALMVAKLAQAMQVAHDGGVVHRDLKPANVVVNKRGEPVILDFGLARQLNDQGTRLTQIGAIYGTPAYMAPEQAGGDPEKVGPAADVYALGVILYEFLTGDVPFAGPPMVLLFNTVNIPPVPPRQRNPAVDAALEAICLKALAKKPNDRQGSMKELAKALVQAGRAVPSKAGLPPAQQPPPQDKIPTHSDIFRQQTIPPPLPQTPTLLSPQRRETLSQKDRIREDKAPAVPVSPVHTARQKPRSRTSGIGAETRMALAMVLVLLGLLGLAGWYGYGIWQRRQKARDEKVVKVERDSSDTKDPPKVDAPKVSPMDKPKDAPKVEPDKNPPKVDPPKVDPPKDPPKKDPPKVDPPKNIANTLGMKFVALPKRTFYMGGGGGKVGTKTEIKEDFEIATTTVTQGQWQAIMDDNPSLFSRDGLYKEKVKDIPDADLKRFPVENVSWDMAQEFIEKLNKKEAGTGWTYRLPTEAEWEYACRGGATTEADCSWHFYFDKPTNDLSAKEANFDGDNPFGTAPKVKALDRPTMVDDPAYPTNRLGLHHMHGNVWQWCSDLYGEGGSGRVIRGGGWRSGGQGCRASDRYGFAPTDRYDCLGFRVARVPSGK